LRGASHADFLRSFPGRWLAGSSNLSWLPTPQGEPGPTLVGSELFEGEQGPYVVQFAARGPELPAQAPVSRAWVETHALMVRWALWQAEMEGLSAEEAEAFRRTAARINRRVEKRQGG
jgi:hypothetical protein